VVLCGYSVIVQLLKTFHGSVTDIGGVGGGGDGLRRLRRKEVRGEAK
jgi:hypothetical protein